MRSPKQISKVVASTCAAIYKRFNGRVHPKENEIIAEECIIHDISECHIRNVLKVEENSKRSVKYREMKL